MLLIAIGIFKTSKADKNNRDKLIKLSIKYAIISGVIITIYTFIALLLHEGVEYMIANYDYYIIALFFMTPVGLAFGQLVALIKWKLDKPI